MKSMFLIAVVAFVLSGCDNGTSDLEDFVANDENCTKSELTKIEPVELRKDYISKCRDVISARLYKNNFKKSTGKTW